MNNKLIFILAVCLPFFSVLAQDTSKDKQQDVIRYKEFTLGVKLHTQGYGVVLNSGKILNIRKKNLWEIEFQEVKHPKEQKVQSYFTSDGSTNRYIYGKRNHFFNLNFLIGRERMITEKLRKKGVSFSYLYKFGASLGILKPYYLELVDDFGAFTTTIERYSPENSNKFLDPTKIIGKGGFGYGFNEARLVPGGVLKVGMEADWASDNQIIKALEAGLMINAYYKDVPIMAESDNQFIFINLYMSFKLGNRK